MTSNRVPVPPAMRHSALLTVLALAATVFATGARADIWKQVDSNGHVQYSDRWSPGAVLIKAAHPTDDSANTDEQKRLAATSRHISDQLHEEAAARSVEQDEAAKRQQQCKEAQDRYASVVHARRIYTTDDSGNRQYLSNDEADQQRAQAKADVDAYCGSG